MFTFFRRGEFRGLGVPQSLLPWLKKTRTIRPDLALDFQGLLRSALIAKISGAKEIYGMSDGREGSRFFYDRVAKVNRRGHAVNRYLKLAECAGATIGESLRWPIPTGDPLPRFDEHPPFILLHPFARGGGKSLSTAVIEEFCRAFCAHARGDCRTIAAQDRPPENCIDLTNQTSLVAIDLAHSRRAICRERGQRPDAHCRRRQRSLIVDPYVDRSMPCRSLQSQRLGLETWATSTGWRTRNGQDWKTRSSI